MDKYFVYYSDEYDVSGLNVFDSEEGARQFIDARLTACGFEGSIDNYRVVKGVELAVLPVEVVKSVKLQG